MPVILITCSLTALAVLYEPRALYVRSHPYHLPTRVQHYTGAADI